MYVQEPDLKLAQETQSSRQETKFTCQTLHESQKTALRNSACVRALGSYATRQVR